MVEGFCVSRKLFLVLSMIAISANITQAMLNESTVEVSLFDELLEKRNINLLEKISDDGSSSQGYEAWLTHNRLLHVSRSEDDDSQRTYECTLKLLNPCRGMEYEFTIKEVINLLVPECYHQPYFDKLEQMFAEQNDKK
jgi:hypothetical protein